MVFLVVMGVCGCGKTTIGQGLAKKLKVAFNDADDFHSSANKRKMNQGIPLNDEDRLPWLSAIHKHIKSAVDSGQKGVVACSALKKMYRTVLTTGSALEGKANVSIENDVIFVYLKGSYAEISHRLSNRKDHFMPAGMLDSQLAILEEPDEKENHLVVAIDSNAESIIDEIVQALHE